MSNLFHLALHIQESDNIVNKMSKFYQEIFGEHNAGQNKGEHAFARCGNTLLAFEPRKAVEPQTLSFFATPDEMIKRIQKNCKIAKVNCKRDSNGNIALFDPAGNKLFFERQPLNARAKQMGMRVVLGVIDLEKTQAFYKSHFDCKISKTEDALNVDFFGHELIFSKGKKVGKGFTLNSKVVKQAKETQLLVAEHFGITDLTKTNIDQIISGFKNGKDCLLAPMIANKGGAHEEIYTFVEDPSGHAVELRYLKNPNISLKEVEKITQQNDNIEKEPYHVLRANKL